MEQMALCVRYYDAVVGELREDFLGFSHAKSTTGEALADAFMEKLQAYGIDTHRMRGQGYDGAANMAGRYRGVQARIRGIIPGALYTHCKAHNLNLSIVHASKEVLVRNMFDTVQEIAFSFNYSAKRLLNFQDTLENLDPDEMTRRTKLQSLCETRWAARADALYTFKAAFGVVCATLEELSEEHGDAKARAFRNSITKFDFIITLVAAEHVLSGLVPLSNLLQKKTCDLIEAKEEAEVIIRQVTGERNDGLVWDALYDQAVEIATEVGVVPNFPRNQRAQRNRPNVPSTNAKEYWQRNMYLPFVDHLISELETRLLTGSDRFKAQFLLPLKLTALTNDVANEIFDVFEADINISREQFRNEICRWKSRWAGSPHKPETIAEVMGLTNRDLYPGVKTCLEVLLCMPVSTATAERSFSTTRRVKTYLRSTMTTSRLSGLGLLNIYREREIDIEKVTDIFAGRKQRRLSMLFRV